METFYEPNEQDLRDYAQHCKKYLWHPFFFEVDDQGEEIMYTKSQVWAVISYGTGQFDIFSADTEEEILGYCEDNGYTVEEWNGTEEAADRALKSREKEMR